jgi:hypothetical protein
VNTVDPGGTGLRALLLVDTDTAGDRRVLRWYRRLSERATRVDTLDIRNNGAGHSAARAAMLALQALLAGLAAAPRLAPRLRGRVAANPFLGLSAVWRWLGQAVRAAQSAAGPNAPSIVVANDLYCGVAASLAGWPAATRVVYDSHELQIHRHRKVGWLRVLVEHGLEQRVLRRADEVRVVNRAIADVMAQWHGPLARATIDLNDHYAHREAPSPPATARPALVYVGMATHGRLLERLAVPPEALGFDVRLYLLGTAPPAQGAGNATWTFGPIDYEADLLAHVRGRRCLMWCCLERRSLSYQLATPNKFFQALAAGVPVLASADTYLGELVRRHGIGAVLEDQPLAALAQQVQGEAYPRWVEAVVRLRQALRTGAAVA